MFSRRCLLTVLVCRLWMVATAARADGQGACAKEAATKTWQRASLEGVELEYRTVGAGEPVVLVHAGVFADWFEPLLKEPSLSRHYCLVTYHRVGYAGSSHVAGPVSIAQQAAHVRALMELLRNRQCTSRRTLVRREHHHAAGAGCAAESAFAGVAGMALSLPASSPGRAGIPQAIDLYRAGDKAGAVDTFMRAVAGPGYRAVADRVLPGAFDQAVRDADTFFGQELPAIRQWIFGPTEAARIKQPVLLVMGGRSHEVSPVWQQRQDLLITWMSNAEPFVLDGATHMLHLENARGLAERLGAFFTHPPAK